MKNVTSLYGSYQPLLRPPFTSVFYSSVHTMRLETCSLTLLFWMALVAIVAMAQDPTSTTATTTTMPTTQQDALDMNDIVKDASAWLEQMQLDDERICLGSRSRSNYYHHADNYLYTCTTRGLHYQQLLQNFYKHNNNEAGYFDLGVTQRIDGTDQEKEGIVEVLSLMRHYFLNEVLVKPVYEGIRHNWYVACFACNYFCSFFLSFFLSLFCC